MEKPKGEDIIKKWAPILNSMGVTGSKAEWMSEYVEMHSNNEVEKIHFQLRKHLMTFQIYYQWQ